MASLNSFDFTGWLGRDPELRSTPGGHEVCNLAVAIDTFGDKPTLWVDVSVWGASASSCARWLAKGREVAVHGQVDEIHAYERKDGETGTSLRVSTRDVAFIGPKGDPGPSQGSGEDESGFTPRSDVPSDTGDFQPVGAGGPAYDDSQDIPFAPSVI